MLRGVIINAQSLSERLEIFSMRCVLCGKASLKQVMIEEKMWLAISCLMKWIDWDDLGMEAEKIEE